jgi:type II secretory pathway pseudopilin PulG
MQKQNKQHRRQGFSLIELMIAGSISVVVTGMILSTYIQCMYGLNDSQQRMNLAYEMHSWTNELNARATQSNQFALYKTSTDLTTPQVFATSGSTLLSPGGDVAVFAFYKFPKPTNSPVHAIRRVDVYSLTGKGDQEVGRIEHISIEFATGKESDKLLQTILTDTKYYEGGNWKAFSDADVTVRVQKLFPQVRGLAIPEHEDGDPITGTPPNRLFYMSAERNVMVMGQHYSGNMNRNTNDRRTHTNGFSFNITPRT